MADKYNETEYMYGSARVRALENSLVGAERLYRMADAKSSDEIISSLPDAGFDIIYAENGVDVDREATLLSVLSKGYSDISAMLPRPGMLDFLRYPYDCNNIKAVIKCASRGVDPRGMLFDFGTVGTDVLADAVAGNSKNALPENMEKAVARATEAFNSTGNPQCVDFIMDRACYADMLAGAKKTGDGYSADVISARIDLTNIITCVRVMRMRMGGRGKSLLSDALLEGGTLTADFFMQAYEGGEEKLCEMLMPSAYSTLGENLGAGLPLGKCERLAEDLWMNIVKRAKFIPFGIPVFVAYVIALETEVKNVRILLASKDAGLSPEIIRERLRESYV
ncbi:MAG: V-type ATPase subunit [Eubacteriales bacterium]